MDDLLIIYFPPQSDLGEYININQAVGYEELSDLSKNQRKELGEYVDFFSLHAFSEAYNCGRISDEGYIGYLTLDELTELFNL